MAIVAAGSTEKAPVGWYDKNRKEVAYCVMLSGFALTMICLGALAVGSAVPFGPTIPDSEWVHLQDLHDYMLSGVASGYLAVFVGLAGLGIIGLGAGMLRRANAAEKREAKRGPAEKAVTTAQAADEANHKKRRNITLILGVAIAMIGIGMIINSSILLHNSVPSVQDLVERAIREKWAHQDFWQAVKTEWLQPVQWRLPLLATVGVFATIGGGGLMLSASGYSLCRKALKKLETDPVAASDVLNSENG